MLSLLPQGVQENPQRSGANLYRIGMCFLEEIHRKRKGPMLGRRWNLIVNIKISDDMQRSHYEFNLDLAFTGNCSYVLYNNLARGYKRLNAENLRSRESR